MSATKKTNLFDIQAILSKMCIGEGQRVAELGCGNFGFFVYPLARLVGRQGKVYAVDIIKSTLEVINKEAKKDNLPQIETIWSNLEKFKATQIENSSLDSALLVNVIHESDKKIEILRESIRLVKRGGTLLIVEWKSTDLPFGPSIENRVKIDSLKNAAPKIGLALKEEFEAGPYHYGLILTKL